ncbi:alpha/beta hydrolase fold domain-containing protein [Streptomyces sp. NPDC047081]|uniref:alpha/beta hydrolase n=1 Tax=Streptomyces sp. NPDC047081 TaxID=3154706 RepID=UPI0034099153
MPSSKYPSPPFDAELQPVLDAILESFSPSLHPEDIPALRAAKLTPGPEELVQDRPVTHTEHIVPGPAGDLTVSVFARSDHNSARPALFFTHVGGLIFGDRFNGIAPLMDHVEELDLVAVTVEYRLAPEHPSPAAVEDSYAALKWTAEHAAELGIDPDRIITAGASAGGGLAAALALMARDNNGPAVAGQMLMYPVLDDRDETVSTHQNDGIGVWDRTSNLTGWNAALGERRGTTQVSIYEAPARATDLSHLPPAYIEVGSNEVFRDESVVYATGIWAAGGAADLHVWAGGFHLFGQFAPDTAISRAARDTRTNWLRRTFQL